MLEEIVEMERPISDINDMTKQELRVELKKRGLSTSGIKSALVGRLKEAEEFVRTSPVKYFTIDFENDINKLPSMIALLHPYIKRQRYHRGHDTEVRSSNGESNEKTGLMNGIEKSEQMVDSYVGIVNKYERAIAIIDNNNILIVESDGKVVDDEVSNGVDGDVNVNLCESEKTVDEGKTVATDAAAVAGGEPSKFTCGERSSDGPLEMNEFATNDTLRNENGEANGCTSTVADDRDGGAEDENHRADNDATSASVDDDERSADKETDVADVPEEGTRPISSGAVKRKRSECDSDETESLLSDVSVEPCRDSGSDRNTGSAAGDDTTAATEIRTTTDDSAASVKKREIGCSPDSAEVSARRSCDTDETSGSGPSADGKDGDLRKQRSNKRKKGSNDIDDIIARTLPPLKDVEAQNAELNAIESPEGRLVYLEDLVKTLRAQYMSMKKKIKIIDDRMKKIKGRSQQSEKNV